MSRGTGEAARQAAVMMLHDVLKHHLTIDEALTQHDQKLTAPDRALARAICHKTLRHLGQIDRTLFQLIKNPRPLRHHLALMILRSAAAQLLFMRVPDHAAVDLAVGLAQKKSHTRHFAQLINAVLRQIATQPVKKNTPLSCDTPPWLWKKWVRTYGEQNAQKIAAAHLAGDEIDLDLTLKTDQENQPHDLSRELTQKLSEELHGVFLAPNTLRLTGNKTQIEQLPFYQQGLWWVQNIAASLPARLFGDIKNQPVLELCAAPGGKTAQLAAAGARVIAIDRDPKRVQRLRDNLARLQLDAEIIVKDGCDYHSSSPFRFILLDAPCSGTGTMRRHPEIAWTNSPKIITRLVKQQKRLLRAAYRLLAQGGTLIYCVCSLEPEEGIDIINHFLKEYPHMQRHPIQPDEVGAMNHILTPLGDIRSLPFHQPQKSCAPGPQGGMDGFYSARLIRKKESL